MHFLRTADILREMAGDALALSSFKAMAARIVHTKRNNGMVYAFGNGGSAADSAHFCGELAGWYEDKQRPAIPAMDLSAQVASLTAVANDRGYEQWPARFLRGAPHFPSCCVFLTTSGKSPNVREALDVCLYESASVFPILITGNGIDDTDFLEKAAAFVNSGRILVHVIDSLDTPVVQEVTQVILHHVCMLVDAQLKRSP